MEIVPGPADIVMLALSVWDPSVKYVIGSDPALEMFFPFVRADDISLTMPLSPLDYRSTPLRLCAFSIVMCTVCAACCVLRAYLGARLPCAACLVYCTAALCVAGVCCLLVPHDGYQVEWYSGVKPTGEEVQVMRPGSSVPTGVGSAARCLFLSLEVVAASKDYYIQRRFTAEGYMWVCLCLYRCGGGTRVCPSLHSHIHPCTVAAPCYSSSMPLECLFH